MHNDRQSRNKYRCQKESVLQDVDAGLMFDSENQNSSQAFNCGEFFFLCQILSQIPEFWII